MFLSSLEKACRQLWWWAAGGEGSTGQVFGGSGSWPLRGGRCPSSVCLTLAAPSASRARLANPLEAIASFHCFLPRCHLS